MRVGLVEQVATPLSLASDLELATATSLQFNWEMVADHSPEIPVLGYKLEILLDDDTWSTAFEARNDPNAINCMVYGLQTHKKYFFRVFARDFNGYSLPSTVFEIYACGLPRLFPVPTYVWST